MFETIQQDYEASRASKPFNLARMIFRAAQDSGFRAVCLYRVGRWARLNKYPLIPALTERMMHHLSHVWISTLADLGAGFRIAHVCGIIVPPGIEFGRQCEIRQNVTLGGNYGKRSADGRTNPKLGNHVSIGPGAVLLGPIEIGDHSIIGANAVVTTSIPAHSVVAGFRGEVVATRDESGEIVRDEKKVFLSRKALFERIETLETKIQELSADKGPTCYD